MSKTNLLDEFNLKHSTGKFLLLEVTQEKFPTRYYIYFHPFQFQKSPQKISVAFNKVSIEKTFEGYKRLFLNS